MNRSRLRFPTLAIVVAMLLAIAAPAAAATLEIDAIEILGNERTHRATVLRHLPLAEGDHVTPEQILAAVDALRASELFEAVEYRVRPGASRGVAAVVLQVREKGLEFRFGTGYRDLDGWYLIPAQLRMDNRLGQGEQTRLQARIGYRVAGVELIHRNESVGEKGRGFWGANLAGLAINRPYFHDGIEYRHHVSTAVFGAHAGRRFGSSWSAVLGVRHETVEADSVPESNETDEVLGVETGDALPFEDLPAEISRHVGEAHRRIVGHTELVYDTRSSELRAGAPASGLWGRLRGELILREGADIGSITADFRVYREAAGGLLALRVRGGAIGEAAPFWDRHYLGGLYTVRGFPNQSLSPTGGDTRYWSASLEFRGAMVGSRANPRLAGLLFVDAGDGWRGNATTLDDASASAGYGFRLRVPWIGSLGLDVGIPITDSPTKDAFFVNGSLGWNF